MIEDVGKQLAALTMNHGQNKTMKNIGRNGRVGRAQTAPVRPKKNTLLTDIFA